jgi:hypothetical protein
MKNLSRILLAATLATTLLATGCAVHRQVYVWGPGETTFYAQWEGETHRDHVAWEQRSDADHNAYWAWRKHHR